jgi:[ribosomal protein S5]-alanine N-acetyltransferase
MSIETQRLKLIHCNREILLKAVESNKALAEFLNIEVPNNWTEYGVQALNYVLNKIIENPSENDWWTYFPILKESNILIGSGGFKGPPDENGVVEIGYEISPQYRNQGLASEYAQALIQHAASINEVKSVIAHTLAKDNPSTSILKKLGFQKSNEFSTPDKELIWKWCLMIKG